MSRYIPDGVLQVHYVASIANRATPTLLEVQAGTPVVGFLRALSTPLEGSVVDVSDASSKFNKTATGTFGGQMLTGEFYRDDTVDTAYDTLPRGTTGHFVVARHGGSGADGALAVGDEVEVWQIEVATRNPKDYSRNDPDGFAIACAVPSEPSLDVALT
jgi:hypothetical protein